jgi:hypothetical protein
MKSTSQLIKTSTALLSFRGRFILVILTVASAMLLPEAHAVNPPPDGSYAGFNTAEGLNAPTRTHGRILPFLPSRRQ